jgi:predicted metal-dependent peptidase
MDAQLKVSRALIKLVSNRAFYGSCALRLNIVEDKTTQTMATDGRSIFWGREAVDEWTEEEVEGVLAHEVLHVVLLHHLRKQDRSHKKWNIATDFSINETLDEDGFKLPKGALQDRAHRNKNAEKVYDDIKDQYYEDPEWGYVMDMTDKDGNPVTGDEKDKAIDDVNEMIAAAADAAEKAGQDLHGNIEELVKNVGTPKVNWRSFIRTTLMSNKPEDYSWSRPNRKMLSALDLYTPRMVSTAVGPLAVVLDTSASVSMKEREAFLAELQSINESLKPEAINIVCVDTSVAVCYSFTPHDDITELKLSGGGGTDMTPGFNYVLECLPETETLLCFSDCEFNSWPEEPALPVIWLSTGHTDNPYGTLVKVEV